MTFQGGFLWSFAFCYVTIANSIFIRPFGKYVSSFLRKCFFHQDNYFESILAYKLFAFLHKLEHLINRLEPEVSNIFIGVLEKRHTLSLYSLSSSLDVSLLSDQTWQQTVIRRRMHWNQLSLFLYWSVHQCLSS
jgi:hypothetical protein